MSCIMLEDMTNLANKDIDDDDNDDEDNSKNKN
jgi:hypothetical protein